MAFKVFLDANIFLEAYLDRKYEADASKLLHLISEHEVLGYTSPAVLQVCAYFLEKEMTPAQIKKLFLALLDYIKILDAQHVVVVAALKTGGDDIEDAILYHTAVHDRMDYFISYDKGLAKLSSPVLPVITPTQFFKKAGL